MRNPALFLSTMLVPVLLTQSALAQSQDATDDPITLEQVWVTPGLTEPEGVAFDRDGLFISNMVGSDASKKDGEGWISRVSFDGQLQEEKWLAGMHAPKGMAVQNGKLFVSDIDAFHVVNIETAQIERTHSVEGAVFLNDVVVWKGEVFMSDSRTARIFKIDENGYAEWMSDERLTGVNGLTADGDRLLIAAMGSGDLYETYDGKTLNALATGMVNGDGIAVLDDGGYLVSSWPGQIWHASRDGEVTLLADTENDPQSQNDLTRVGDLIIIPSKVPGIVTAWQVSD